MITEGVMTLMRTEIAKAEALLQQMKDNDQPALLIAKQEGAIDGLKLAEQLLGDYSE